MAWKWWKCCILFRFSHNRFCCYLKFSLGLNPGLGLVPRVIIDTVLCAPTEHANTHTNCMAGMARKIAVKQSLRDNFLEKIIWKWKKLCKQMPTIDQSSASQPTNRASNHIDKTTPPNRHWTNAQFTPLWTPLAWMVYLPTYTQTTNKTKQIK